MKDPISGEPYLKSLLKNLAESRSSSCTKSVYTCSDCPYGLCKHQKMRAISRLLSRMVLKTKARENLEQLQGSLRSSVQGNPKIIKDLEDQRICSNCASRTSQCGAFLRGAAGPHHGAGKSCNGNISRQNLGRAVDKDNIGAIEPSRYPNRETCDSAIRECPSGKIGTLFGLGQARPLGVQKYDPIRSELDPRPQCLFKERNFVDPNRYCSSRGYKVEESHTSATFRFPKYGHNILARRMDIKGGQTCNKEWINSGLTD